MNSFYEFISQLQFSIYGRMLYTLKQRFIFGLFIVILTLQSFKVEAGLGKFFGMGRSSDIRQRPIGRGPPLNRNGSPQLQRSPPRGGHRSTVLDRASSTSSSDSYNSLANIELNERSTNSLNRGSSPAIMRESLHHSAASALNVNRARVPGSSTILTRMKPNPENIKKMALMMKNSAIGVAGVAGAITIGKSFSSGCEKSEIDCVKKNRDEQFAIIKTTTERPEIYNPVG